MTVVASDRRFDNDSRFVLSLLAAFALHGIIVALLVYGIPHSPRTLTPQLAIKAVVIDNTAKRVKREQEQADAERVAREQAEAEKKAREQAEAEQQQREREAQEEAKRQEDLRQRVAADEKRKADDKRKADEKQAVARKQADAKRAADIKAKQAEKQKAEREAREQTQRENELKRQLADEEGIMQAESSGLMSQYAALIQQKVVSKWNKPASARAGIQCEVRVTQVAGGVVASVQVQADKCNGDAAVRQSIEAAVLRASPLPPPPDARLFQRVIVFVFKPTE